MADVSILNVREGSYDSLTTSTIVASAATGTIPCGNGKDNRMAVLVKNGDAALVQFNLVAPTSGGGVRASRGNVEVEIAGGDEALIPLFDTARFKRIVSNDIEYSLTDTNGGALTTEIANVTIVAMQL